MNEPDVPFNKGARENLVHRAKGSGARVAFLNLVATVLQGEAIEYYKLLWDKYDRNHDGRMDINEFKKMMKKQFGVPGPRNGRWRKLPASLSRCLPVEQLPSPEELFSYADCDENGYISFDEFVGIMFNPDELDTATKITYFRSAFATISGGEDYITTDELSEFFGGDVDVTEIFEEMDEDQDGYITSDEFISYVEKL